MRRQVAIGLLGTVKDGGPPESRWERWRPTLGLCQQEDLVVDRLELLHEARFQKLADQVVADLAAVSPETEIRLRPIDLGDPWDFESVYAALHDFAKGYPFDPEEEDYLVHITTGTHVAQICLFLLAEARFLPARLVQTSPPKRRGEGAAGRYAVIDLDLSKYDRLAARFAEATAEVQAFLKSGIATRNAVFNRMIGEIERVALNSRAPLLLMGPTGAGKSHLARRIYDFKRRRGQVAGEFVEVNCATLRGDAAMSTLFGHVKGAFTGAAGDRPGLLRAADGGVLFLDEIGELGADEQAMLLRALEEGRFLPLGSDREAGSDFQLISGTNRDLEAAAAGGRFRADLLARINLWTFTLPGLSERPEDIGPNLDYEAEAFARRHGHPVRFNREARAAFLRFATAPDATWKANFRDLNAAVTRMATLAEGRRITVEAVAAEAGRLRAQWAAAERREGGGAAGADNELEELLGPERVEELDRFDQVQLAEVVRVCRRSPTLSEAGRQLFAVSRTRKKVPNDADRLKKYLARFGLDWAAVRGRERGAGSEIGK